MDTRRLDRSRRGLGLSATDAELGRLSPLCGRLRDLRFGDIAPAVGLPAAFTDQPSLTGVFVGLIVLIVLGTMFITPEYRRGMIQTTFAAGPRRSRVLAAKAIVIASVTFLAGAGAAAVSIPLGDHLLRANGNYVYPASTLTELR